MSQEAKDVAKIVASRLASSKVAARIAIFGFHVAAFGAAYHFAGSSIDISITMTVLSLVCLAAEQVLASHFTSLVGNVGGGLRLRHVFSVWYLFAVCFWAYKAVSNFPK